LHLLFRLVNLKEGDHLEDLDVDWRIIVNLSQRRSVGECGRDLSGSAKGLVEGCCEHGNEPSGSIKCADFLGQLRNS
jgi:hypothetical protein